MAQIRIKGRPRLMMGRVECWKWYPAHDAASPPPAARRPRLAFPSNHHVLPTPSSTSDGIEHAESLVKHHGDSTRSISAMLAALRTAGGEPPPSPRTSAFDAGRKRIRKIQSTSNGQVWRICSDAFVMRIGLLIVSSSWRYGGSAGGP